MDDDRLLTNEQRYAAAERIRGMYPDGLIAFLLAEVERWHTAFDLADEGLSAEMMHNGELGRENERLREEYRLLAAANEEKRQEERDMSRSSDRIEAKHRLANQCYCACGNVLNVLGERIHGKCFRCQATQRRTYTDADWQQCTHCDGTGQRLWRAPEIAGGVGEECICEWCHGAGKQLRCR